MNYFSHPSTVMKINPILKKKNWLHQENIQTVEVKMIDDFDRLDLHFHSSLYLFNIFSSLTNSFVILDHKTKVKDKTF